MLYLVLGLVLIVASYFLSQVRPKNYPPGPYGLPIIGNLLQLAPAPYLALMKLSEKYGPIVAVDLGSYRGVGISDYRIIKEALAQPAFNGRPQLNVFKYRSRDVVTRGLLFTDGQQWKEQRRFTIRQLSDLGYAKRSLETVIQTELVEFIRNLKDECNVPISLRAKFSPPILNILWTLIVGERDETGEVARIFDEITKHMANNNGLTSIPIFLPFLAKLFPKLSGYDEMNTLLGPIWAFMQRHIQNHKNSYVPGQVRDYIDAYLQEMENASDPASSFYKETGEKSLAATLLDLFFAGGETTSTTLHWTCLYMALYPEVQEKLQAEIDERVGRTRLPSLSDRDDMKYTAALIQEVLRHSTLLPQFLFRNTTENVELRGYRIPKDTMLIMNIYSAFHDKKYWGNPETFMPERFLDSKGELVKHEPMFAFGSGSRVCIGETLARNELFLWITALLQNFTITKDPAKPNITADPVITWLQLPPDHHLIFKQRNV